MAKILVTSRGEIKGPNVSRIKTRLRKILKGLNNPKGELSILFTGDSEMKRLNSHYRGKKKTTDVLSFSSEGGPGPATLGDIVVSIPTARRQAKKLNRSMERETLHLLTHGLLHLLGYDHEKSKTAAAKMEQKHASLMALGYGK